MNVKIIWPANPESDIANYEVQRATAAGGAYALVATVLPDIAGPNYDPAAGVFFYVDPEGGPTDWYRLVAVDTLGARSAPSAPFQATTSDPPSIAATAKLDQDYGGRNALRYQNTAGTPIEGAVVRVFRQSDFMAGDTSVPLGVTMTDSFGRWIDPVFVAPGFSYVVQFHLEGQYGPNHVTVVV